MNTHKILWTIGIGGCLLFLGWMPAQGDGFSINPPPHPDTAPYTLAEARTSFENLHSDSERTHPWNAWHNCTGARPGTWETQNFSRIGPLGHSVIRAIATRVSAYLQAYRVDPNSIYSDRARDGLDCLVDSVQLDGRYETWTDGDNTLTDGDAIAVGNSSSDDAFTTADAGEALAEGYRTFGTEAYRTAAQSAADWQLHGRANGSNADPVYQRSSE